MPLYIGSQWRHAPLHWWPVKKGTLELVGGTFFHFWSEGEMCPLYTGGQWELLHWSSVGRMLWYFGHQWGEYPGTLIISGDTLMNNGENALVHQ